MSSPRSAGCCPCWPSAVRLTSYPGTVRQLVVTGLGRDQPTVIITNDDQVKTRALVQQYGRRMTIEQRLAEIIRAFCADALSSTVNLNVERAESRRDRCKPGGGTGNDNPEPVRDGGRHRGTSELA